MGTRTFHGRPANSFLWETVGGLALSQKEMPPLFFISERSPATMRYWVALPMGLDLRKIHSTWTLKFLHIEQEFSRKAAKSQRVFVLCASASLR